MRFSVLNVAAAALAFTGLSSAANMTEWKSRSIYQVMIDRFARTDGSTTAPCEEYLFCGGSWTGLINKLDYIVGMGFDAIQISPIVKNTEDHTSVGDPYHGYWSQDNYALNEHFGTEDDFKNLVAEVHKRGMFLMVDVVVNNMAQGFNNVIPPKVDYSKFNPFNDQKYFHPYCNVTEWENATDYQNCWLYPYGVALADINTNSPTVVSMMQSWITGLVKNYTIDGLRIDAAKHVNDAFLPAFVEAAGVFSIGEVLTGVTNDMCRYQTLGLLQGMPNYLTYYPMTAAFNGGSFVDVANILNQAQTGCNDTFALGTFMENHDMPRFASTNEDMALASNAMTFVMLHDGMPTVYQGQEQHFKGNGTPWNREPLWQSSYNTSAPLYTLTATLNKVRSNAIKLSPDYLETPSTVSIVDVNHLCLNKGGKNAQVIFCINNKSSKGDSYQMTLTNSFEPNTQVVEVTGCTTSQVDGAGNLVMYMYHGEPRVYVPASQLKDTGLCPQTTTAGMKSPNAASGVSMAGGLAAAMVVGWATLFLA